MIYTKIILYFFGIFHNKGTNMKQQTYILQSFDHVNTSTASRLHNLGLCKGCPIKVVQRYPFHGPVIIENHHQRIGLRYHVFVSLTEDPWYGNSRINWQS